jgi:hypothetical protein
MANFTKIFGLAGATLIFAGLSYGQATTTCTTAANPASPGLIRAEGTTELVAEFSFSCNNTGAAAASATILDIVSLPVTSKVLNTSTGATEAALVTGAQGAAPTILAYGTVSGNQVTFSNVSLPTGTTTYTIINVRVNASGLTVGTGTPPAVTESLFISGPTTTAGVIAATPVAYALQGLSTVKLYQTLPTAAANAGQNAQGVAQSSTATQSTSKGVNNFVVCNAINKGTSQSGILSVINVGENFATAFKGLVGGPGGNPAGNTTLGSEFTNNTETGVQVTNSANNTATEPTTIAITLSNVPTNLSVYFPTTIVADQTSYLGTAGGTGNPVNSGNAGFLTLVSSSGSAATALNGTSTITAGTAQVTATSGSATAYYQFTPGTNSSTITETFSIPVYGVATANSITASSTAVTAAVSFFPTGTTTIPSFVVGPSTVSQTLSTFSGCTTSLLFPFVTNQVGFDTGIAIANTSTDPFGTKGATAQSGTCTMNFYGSGAPSPNSITTANVPSGTVYTAVLSGVAAGFQGYIIAQCQFQYAHGFAFLTDGVGSAGGLSEGYLAGVIPDVNQVTGGRPANPSAIAGAGTGETLGN